MRPMPRPGFHDFWVGNASARFHGLSAVQRGRAWADGPAETHRFERNLLSLNHLSQRGVVLFRWRRADSSHAFGARLPIKVAPEPARSWETRWIRTGTRPGAELVAKGAKAGTRAVRGSSGRQAT